MKLVINSFITIKQKGVIVFLKAFLNFFLILYYKKFLSPTLIKKKIFNFKMFLNPFDKGISRTLILFGVRELDHKKILELVLKKNMKVFDIGANIGYYVLMESSIIGKKGKIIAIEPVPENMKLLKKNLKLNQNYITNTMQVGVSNTSTKKNFLLSEHSNLGHIIEDKNNQNYKNKKKIEIQTLSLNTLIKKTFCPDFIRMDVEGYEELILKNLINLKLKKYPIICFETHLTKYKKTKMKEVLTKLFDKGYRIKYASSSSELGSSILKSLGYKPIIKNIKTDDVTREIFVNIKKNHSIKLICETGGLRTILMVNNKI